MEVKSSPYARPNARLPALVGKGAKIGEEKADRGIGTENESCQWARTDPEIPNSRSPDSRFGRESGEGIPDSRLGRNREAGIPDSRFGRERESGSRLTANREIGDTLSGPSVCGP